MKSRRQEKHGRSRRPPVLTRDRPTASRIDFLSFSSVVDSVASNNRIMHVVPMDLASVDRVDDSIGTDLTPVPQHIQSVTAHEAWHSTCDLYHADSPATTPHHNDGARNLPPTVPPQHGVRTRKQPHPTRWVNLTSRRSRPTRPSPRGPLQSTGKRRHSPPRPPPHRDHRSDSAPHMTRPPVNKRPRSPPITNAHGSSPTAPATQRQRTDIRTCPGPPAHWHISAGGPNPTRSPPARADPPPQGSAPTPPGTDMDPP